MKKLLFIFLVSVGIFLQHTNAAAHVLITDDTNSIGAVLHITPDDDPVAGEPASFYLDLQNQQVQSSVITLTVRDISGSSPGTEKNLGDTTTYTFPSQGLYELIFTASADGATYTFTHSLLVSRGIAGGALEKPSYAWAEILLLVSGIALILLSITAFNRRKEIARQSTF